MIIHTTPPPKNTHRAEMNRYIPEQIQVQHTHRSLDKQTHTRSLTGPRTTPSSCGQGQCAAVAAAAAAAHGDAHRRGAAVGAGSLLPVSSHAPFHCCCLSSMLPHCHLQTASQLMASASSSMKRCLKLSMLLMRPDLQHSGTGTAQCVAGGFRKQQPEGCIGEAKASVIWSRAARKACGNRINNQHAH